MILQKYRFILMALVMVGLHLIVSFLLMDDAILEIAGQEGGWIENMSVVFLAQAVGLGLYAAYIFRDRGWYLYSFMAFAAAFRELDWHRAFTSDSFLKSRFYVTPEYPLWEKLLGVAFIATLIFCALKLIPKFMPALKAVWGGVVHVQAIFACLGLYAGAKFFDGFWRLFPQYRGFEPEYGAMLRYAEESMEMFGAFFLMYAALHLLIVKPEMRGAPHQ